MENDICATSAEKALQHFQRWALREIFRPPRVPICDWVESTVDLSFDLTAHSSGLIRLYPYQREPLAETEAADVREVVLMWGTRLGKSTIWKMSLLNRVHHSGLSGLILYPSYDMAVKVNRDTVLPLLRTVPGIAEDLRRVGNVGKDSYHLPSASSVVYYLGGGAQVVSYTAGWGAIDETDFIKLVNSGEEDGNIDQLRALRTRMKTFPDRLMIACSSPTSPAGPINKAWLDTSRGVYNIRCLGCGQLSSASQLAFPLADGGYAGLQWEKAADGRIVEESIRWVCPHCLRSHEYSEARQMAEQGAYVHQFPELRSKRGYQAGALANPWLWTWLEVAEQQEQAVDADGRKYLMNNVLGRPYKHVRAEEKTEDIAAILEAARAPLPADIARRIVAVTAGIDQQATALGASKYYVYALRAWDNSGNSWSIAAGIADRVEQLTDIVSAKYYGCPVILALLDQGGFGDNSLRTDAWIKSTRNAMYYKGGDARTIGLKDGEEYRLSTQQHFLLLASAIAAQIRLLDALYGPPSPTGGRWAAPAEPPAGYMEQMGAVRPNTRLRDGRGQLFANWSAGSNRHDFFDAEKMAMLAIRAAVDILPAYVFPAQKYPAFILAEKMRKISRLNNLKK